jgi:hypothetical protein
MAYSIVEILTRIYGDDNKEIITNIPSRIVLKTEPGYTNEIVKEVKLIHRALKNIHSIYDTGKPYKENEDD